MPTANKMRLNPATTKKYDAALTDIKQMLKSGDAAIPTNWVTQEYGVDTSMLNMLKRVGAITNIGSQDKVSIYRATPALAQVTGRDVHLMCNARRHNYLNKATEDVRAALDGSTVIKPAPLVPNSGVNRDIKKGLKKLQKYDNFIKALNVYLSDTEYRVISKFISAWSVTSSIPVLLWRNGYVERTLGDHNAYAYRKTAELATLTGEELSRLTCSYVGDRAKEPQAVHAVEEVVVEQNRYTNFINYAIGYLDTEIPKPLPSSTAKSMNIQGGIIALLGRSGLLIRKGNIGSKYAYVKHPALDFLEPLTLAYPERYLEHEYAASLYDAAIKSMHAHRVAPKPVHVLKPTIAPKTDTITTLSTEPFKNCVTSLLRERVLQRYLNGDDAVAAAFRELLVDIEAL